ncbi:MAG: hypothetical protein GXO69_06135, partial [Acidobacteria bacterium]|nr:hypothetical protein [Acidobacteriota bacterium]
MKNFLFCAITLLVTCVVSFGMNPNDDFDLKDYEIVSYTMPLRGEYYRPQDSISASAVVWTNIPGGEDKNGMLEFIVIDGGGNAYMIDNVLVQIPFRPASDPVQLQGNLPSNFCSGYFSCQINLRIDGAIEDGVY